MNYLIGVDIGTQGTKAVLINENGKVLSHSYKGYEVETPKPSWAQQWPDVWVEATIETLKDVVNNTNVNNDNIKGIAISGLYGGSGIPVNKDLEPVAPCLIWMDRRAEEEVEWIKNNIDIDKLYQVTGNHVNSYFGFTKILWYKNNKPKVWKKTKYFIPPANYVIYKLTKELAVDHSSAGNIGGVYDLKERKWSKEMMDDLGIPYDYMPERLVECTEKVGGVTKEISKKTGLKQGTPVMAGGVDAPVATLGAGAFSEGNHVAMIGTSMCWGFITQKANLSKKLVSMPHSINSINNIYTFGGSSTAGALVRWFRDVFGEIEMQAEENTDISAYTLLELKAQDIKPGSEGLLVLPYFMGERSPIWDSDARGTIIGLSLYHSKGHIYRAFMEGVAYALKHNIELVKKTEAELDDEIILVGGVSKSKIWPQIIADVTGQPVRIIKDDVEAPLGDALLAGLGTGVFNEPTVIKDWLEFKEPIIPDEENNKIYEKYYEQYKDVYLNIKGNMHTLTKL
ncbi:MAG: FGGY-family carbohydrate kinase [Halanaerobiales bacterium]|nr:FGGY-family carbohydrate kinase [Halanaerobiales bacterium]